MLVLTRKAGESLLIGDNIEVQIIEVQGDKVRIGISAPKEVSIIRKELVDEVKKVNREAAVKPQRLSLEDLGDMIKDK